MQAGDGGAPLVICLSPTRLIDRIRGDLRCRDADEQSAALRVKPASGETP
jgi:hypothetical protein